MHFYNRKYKEIKTLGYGKRKYVFHTPKIMKKREKEL